jgi:hypothetical protein
VAMIVSQPKKKERIKQKSTKLREVVVKKKKSGKGLPPL